MHGADKQKIQKLIKSLMEERGINSMTDLGVLLGASKDSLRQNKYSKAKKVLDRLDYEDLLALSGLFQIPMEKLQSADFSVIGHGNIVGNNNKTNTQTLSPQEFLALNDKERKDYLKFLEITSD